MKAILIPVDGSDHALHAVQAALNTTLYPHIDTVHLLTVQPPLLRPGVRLGLTQAEVDAYHEEESTYALKAARQLLDQAGQRYETHMIIGPVAESIVKAAQAHDAREIVMGSRGLGAVGSLVLGSIATKVLNLADRPVTLVR